MFERSIDPAAGIPPTRTDFVEYIYTNCPAHRDCPDEYHVASGPLCEGHVGTYDMQPFRRTRVRGVPAAILFDGSGPRFDSLEIYTARTAISITAPTVEIAMQIAAVLTRPPAADIPPPRDGAVLTALPDLSVPLGPFPNLPPPTKRLLRKHKPCH
jgi:hypothetical protein